MADEQQPEQRPVIVEADPVDDPGPIPAEPPVTMGEPIAAPDNPEMLASKRAATLRFLAMEFPEDEARAITGYTGPLE